MIGHDYLTFADGMDVLLERLSGEQFSFRENGIGVRDFRVSSPYYGTSYESVEGSDGVIDTGTTLGYRQLQADLYFVAVDMADYALKRDEVFRILRSDEAFYITESRNPGKRWLVKISGTFTPDQTRIFGFFDVTFVSASPYAESIGTTLDPRTFDAEKWQFGQGLMWTETDGQPFYVHNTAAFSIFNAGDVVIDPAKRMPLKIRYVGSSSNLSIKNLTTGDEWTHTGATVAGDELVIDNIRSLKNGVSVFKQTNKKLITLAPGWNQFQLTGASGVFTITFDHRFYYL